MRVGRLGDDKVRRQQNIVDMSRGNAQLGGVNIIEAAMLPYHSSGIQLSDKVMVTDKFRHEFNQWLDSQFGKEVDAIMVEGSYYVSPQVMMNLRRHNKG